MGREESGVLSIWKHGRTKGEGGGYSSVLMLQKDTFQKHSQHI